MRTSARVIASCAKGLSIGLLVLVLSACSRTVTWEEEVPLNTGETIWIEREMKWAMLGALGNPFDIGLRPTREQVIRFKYAGRQYRYAGRANIRWIAISPEKRPVLVAKAADFGWAGDHSFYCVVPYYVQFVSDASGAAWTWPERIDTWLYRLPANVMTSLPTPSNNSRRYSAVERNVRDEGYRIKVPHGAAIDPNYKESACIHKFESANVPSN